MTSIPETGKDMIKRDGRGETTTWDSIWPAPAGPWEVMAESMSAWNQLATTNAIALNQEWLSFMRARLEHDANALNALCGCKTNEDVWNITNAFWRQAL